VIKLFSGKKQNMWSWQCCPQTQDYQMMD